MNSDTQYIALIKTNASKYGIPIVLAIASVVGTSYAYNTINEKRKYQLDTDLAEMAKAIEVTHSNQYQQGNSHLAMGREEKKSVVSRSLHLYGAAGIYQALLPRCPQTKSEISKRCQNNIKGKIAEASDAIAALENSEKE